MTEFNNDNSGFLEKLEKGSNVFELIEFNLERVLPDGRKIKGRYGVNVVKVREVVRMPKINPLSSRIKGIEGIFELRGVPIPAINLGKVLGDKEAPVNDDQQIIVVECGMKRAGFIVSETRRIRRVTWDEVLAPSADEASCITAMILIEENEFLFILDLERILAYLEETSNNKPGFSSQPGFSVDSGNNGPVFAPRVEEQVAIGGEAKSVLLVDDSPIILNNVRKELQKAGFRVIATENGKKAFDILEQYANSKTKTEGIDIVVTDIEMPQMDGVTLTKKIREHELLKDMPVLLHSSLASASTRQAGAAVGANGYIVKNDFVSLIALVQETIQDVEKKAAS